MKDGPSQRRVVYIEDDLDNFELVRRVLQRRQYRVDHASDGEAGLTLIEQLRPDLVLLDLDLPGIDGYEVARQCGTRKHMRDIPLVALSAAVMADERSRALAAGCGAFLEKPFEIRDLEQLVDRLIRETSV